LNFCGANSHSHKESKQGILQNKVIAVKKLHSSYTIEDKMFHQEVQSLIMVKHRNIVRFLGYCSHTEEKAMKMEGKIIMAQIRERLLCFDYMSKGSLENHLTGNLYCLTSIYIIRCCVS
jgi:coatomer subunit beta'